MQPSATIWRRHRKGGGCIADDRGRHSRDGEVGRQLLDSLTDDIIDGRDLIRLAETEILRPLTAKHGPLFSMHRKRVSSSPPSARAHSSISVM
ncbi:hypothetical protein VXQ18_08690, partial [Brucella abortus]|nr:hypothetical protein [Brucella abortus]